MKKELRVSNLSKSSDAKESFDDEKSILSTSRICEGIGCQAQATLRVPVKVGESGTIILLLCEKCKWQFLTPN